ncbi:MAG TPA: hypothetical protein PLF84_08380 [Bryobacteraceae bacterium]|nr:hypothetical protein [Bryobacterales bacterium]HRJ19046.1 hypothetical protein [Bryobacteraceae bacterium]
MSADPRQHFSLLVLDNEAVASLLYGLAVTRFEFEDLTIQAVNGPNLLFGLVNHYQVTSKLDYHGRPTLRRQQIFLEFLALTRAYLAACRAGTALKFLRECLLEMRNKRARIRMVFEQARIYNSDATARIEIAKDTAIQTRVLGMVSISACALVVGVGASLTAVTSASLYSAQQGTAATICYAVTKALDGTVVAVNEGMLSSGGFKQEVTTALGWVDMSVGAPAVTFGLLPDHITNSLHDSLKKQFMDQVDDEMRQAVSKVSLDFHWRTRAIEKMVMPTHSFPVQGGGFEEHTRRLLKREAAKQEAKRILARDIKSTTQPLRTAQGIRTAFLHSAIPIIFFGDDCVSAFRYYHEADPERDRHWKAPRPAAR